jgi:chromosome partitioning protein
MQPNAVLVGNMKGGVGKTSVAAQIGGLCAESGWRTLLVDTDPQGNLARHLGVIERSDQGRNLFDAVSDGRPLKPLTDVRPGLDLVPAGDRWTFALPHLIDLAGRGLGLERAIEPIASDYDLILVDTPPTRTAAYDAAALMAHFVLVTTGFDDSSLDGLAGTFRAAVDIRRQPLGNPHLEVLGVVVFGVPGQATSWRARVNDDLEQLLGGQIPVFASVIRSIPATAAALQRHGLLVNQGEEAADAQARRLFERLRKEIEGRESDRLDDVKLSRKSVSGLYEDYLALTKEFQERFTAAIERYAVGTQS